MESVMTDIVVHRPADGSHATTRIWRFITRFARAFDRVMFADRIRCDLDELPDRLRRDIGLVD
jgi:uncharacterized protein YjiS (DUF1127 family)